MGKEKSTEKRIITEISKEVFHLRPVKEIVKSRLNISNKNVGHQFSIETSLRVPASSNGKSPVSLSLEDNYVISPFYQFEDDTRGVIRDLYNPQFKDSERTLLSDTSNNWMSESNAVNSLTTQSNNDTPDELREPERESLSSKNSFTPFTKNKSVYNEDVEEKKSWLVRTSGFLGFGKKNKLDLGHDLTQTTEPRVRTSYLNESNQQALKLDALTEIKQSIASLAEELHDENKNISTLIRNSATTVENEMPAKQIKESLSPSDLSDLRKDINELSKELHSDRIHSNSKIRESENVLQLPNEQYKLKPEGFEEIQRSLKSLGEDIHTDNRRLASVVAKSETMRTQNANHVLLEVLEEIRRSMRMFSQEIREEYRKRSQETKRSSEFESSEVVKVLDELRQTVSVLNQSLILNREMTPPSNFSSKKFDTPQQTRESPTNASVLEALAEIHSSIKLISPRDELKSVSPIQRKSESPNGISDTQIVEVLDEIRESLKLLCSQKEIYNRTETQKDVIPVAVLQIDDPDTRKSLVSKKSNNTLTKFVITNEDEQQRHSSQSYRSTKTKRSNRKAASTKYRSYEDQNEDCEENEAFNVGRLKGKQKGSHITGSCSKKLAKLLGMLDNCELDNDVMREINMAQKYVQPCCCMPKTFLAPAPSPNQYGYWRPHSIPPYMPRLPPPPRPMVPTQFPNPYVNNNVPKCFTLNFSGPAEGVPNNPIVGQKFYCTQMNN